MCCIYLQQHSYVQVVVVVEDRRVDGRSSYRRNIWKTFIARQVESSSAAATSSSSMHACTHALLYAVVLVAAAA